VFKIGFEVVVFYHDPSARGRFAMSCHEFPIRDMIMSIRTAGREGFRFTIFLTYMAIYKTVVTVLNKVILRNSNYVIAGKGTPMKAEWSNEVTQVLINSNHLN